MTERRHGLPPVVTPEVRLLVLGSLPGDASLAASQYYAHPRNQFWRLMQDLLGPPFPALPYEERLSTLLACGVGLWDVVGSAHRKGSLDTSIRDASFNDLATFTATLPALRHVVFNGQTAGRAVPRLPARLTCSIVPSSSPALTLAYPEKLAAWREAFAPLRDHP